MNKKKQTVRQANAMRPLFNGRKKTRQAIAGLMWREIY